MTDDDDDEMRDFVRHLFDSGDDAPHESVGEPTGLTREDLLRQNELAGWGEVTIPGKIITSPETGLPIGVEQSTTEIVHRDTVVYRSQLAKFNLTPEDVPNLIVRDDPEERQQDQ